MPTQADRWMENGVKSRKKNFTQRSNNYHLPFKTRLATKKKHPAKLRGFSLQAARQRGAARIHSWPRRAFAAASLSGKVACAVVRSV